MSDYATLRRVMVDTQVRPSDVTKFPIIQAMLTVPREAFLPNDKAEVAYISEPIDIAPDRTVLAARTFAKMVDALNVTNDMLVLDIGCGYGYSAAVLARIAEAVVAVEEETDLAAEAPGILSETGADNVVLHEGPLTDGAPEHGPYDAIILEGGIEELPAGIEAQLKEGGRIACLFVEGRLGTVRIGYKIDGHLNWRYAFNASAPVLPGFAKTRAFAL
ncbi:Protein-L-isoaspartate O-methyltransferase [Roseivivax sp. THAF40]|uniref:protein-L-isoaspartate O-methyltransferase family protein n=1 Tax=unclassified Roseivivax TaxID=2639302 RepID=UPI0012678A73|nr:MULTISPECIES: protein-L-isoaspartate O-methyltransferase [unclassified Roseivivax]QFS82621.1 Protein-L-isoaspartate O-methyltransferase [Roseivivax sp. THAF197b]QFT46389.1 Protein-L-isoaspartate O-methyltransferase [Roseivivax sp. THAF40]